ncbi:MAG: cytochrome c oxidase assembly factor Coa1 family protein [Pirellulales bacterium]
MSNDRFQIESPVGYQSRKKGWGCFWIVGGVGCLTVLLLSCGGILLTAFWGIKFALSVSEPYQQALRSAKENTELQQLIGDDMTASPVSGSINESNGQGNVEIEMTVTGSKGTGKIHVRGQKINGTWAYEKMIFTDESGNRIDLKPNPLDDSK